MTIMNRRQEFRSLAYDDPNFERLRGSIPGAYTPIQPYPIPYRCFYSRNERMTESRQQSHPSQESQLDR